MFQVLFAWPDELPDLKGIQGNLLIATLMRLQRFHEAERLLLSSLAKCPKDQDLLVLLIILRHFQHQFESAGTLLTRLDDIDSSVGRFLQTQTFLENREFDRMESLPSHWWNEQTSFIPLALSHISWFLSSQQYQSAYELINAIQKPHCMEIVRFNARLLSLSGSYKEAVDILLPAAKRFPQHCALQAEMATLLINARSRYQTIPFLRESLNRHGEQTEFMDPLTRIHLLRREPAKARRMQLLQLVNSSVHPTLFNPSNLVSTYEQLGCADWIPCLKQELLTGDIKTSSIQHNLCSQFASLEAPEYGSYLQSYVSKLIAVPEYKSHQRSGLIPRSAKAKDVKNPLTIAWLTGDLAHHPVSRFLLGFLRAGSTDFKHRHLLVNLKDHESESNVELFHDIQGLEILEVGNLDPNHKLAEIRNHQPHIAIDLSGWTDGNFVTGFLARMAPVQINYLGYFASTGIPSMDFWLGDKHLFPEKINEWHVEEICRLNRCFIAWEPTEGLPEAKAQVTDPPRGAGIRFGCFNHNRKFSDRTLNLWGRILNSIHGSFLVLKANHSGDLDTQELLRRRMLRAGLDPERVIWLPITASPEEHLEQYSQMDVGLDPFPNGGCTTTCEALWMGVPVITLIGRSYVSRMSTAVLNGAGLPEFCAKTEEDYLNLAIGMASRLDWLRSGRDRWRNYIQENSLGDAFSLMQELETTFQKLYLTKCSS